MEKSNLNVFLLGRLNTTTKITPRPWYEIELASKRFEFSDVLS
jgi:hypothetical protein